MSHNPSIDMSLLNRFRPILSMYLKRGFLISSKELNGDLEGILPGESDWILEWFKEEFESFFSENLKKHIELLNKNNGSKVERLNFSEYRIPKIKGKIEVNENKRLMVCPLCQKSILLSDLNQQKVEM